MERTTMIRWTTMMALALSVTLAAGCDRRDGGLEVRTFALEHLQPHEAASLIDPYIYGERAGAPGSLSTSDGAVTVRETPDNLDRIASVLAEFDQPKPETRLHFQLIEADGFTGHDARISDVEQELRRVFQFGGYRLAGETLVTAMNAEDLRQELRAEDGEYAITIRSAYAAAPGVVRLEEIRLWTPGGRDVALQTTVNIRPGQTMVLGSSPKDGSTATLFLAVRAELGPIGDSLQTR